MKFVTIIPFTVWVYLAIEIALWATFGIPGLVIGVVLITITLLF